MKIYASDFEKKILSQLNVSSKILSIKPDTLEYIYSEGKSKLVPVRLQGKVTAGLQYYVSDTICNPDSVLVYAPEGILDTITTAYTQKNKSGEYFGYHSATNISGSVKRSKIRSKFG